MGGALRIERTVWSGGGFENGLRRLVKYRMECGCVCSGGGSVGWNAVGFPYCVLFTDCLASIIVCNPTSNGLAKNIHER